MVIIMQHHLKYENEKFHRHHIIHKLMSYNNLIMISIIISIINYTNANDLNDIEQINSIMSLNGGGADSSGIPSSPSSASLISIQQQQHNKQQQKQREYIQDQNLNLPNSNTHHLNEKRSWQSLQGSWGKRTSNIDNDNVDGSDNNNANAFFQLPEYHQRQHQKQQDDYDSFNNGNFYGINNNDENDDDGILEYIGSDDNNNFLLSTSKAYGISPATTKFVYALHHTNNNGNGIGNDKVMLPDQLQLYTNEQKRGWKSMSGAWGKRLSNGDNWNRFRGSWGKREPGWNNLKGLWGKRATNWSKLQNAWGKRDNSDNIDDVNGNSLKQSLY